MSLKDKGLKRKYRGLFVFFLLTSISLLVALVYFINEQEKNKNEESVPLSDYQNLEKKLAFYNEISRLDEAVIVDKELEKSLDEYQNLAQKNSYSISFEKRINEIKNRLKSKEDDELTRINLRSDIANYKNEVDSLLTLVDSIDDATYELEKTKKHQIDSLQRLVNEKNRALQRSENVKVISFKSESGNLVHYLGEIKNEKANGGGIGVWSTGSIYKGEWKENKRHGEGEFTWADGQRYEGDFVDDIRTGEGTYYWPSGEKYEGEWQNNKRHGKGVLYDPDGNVSYEGKWKKDKPQL
ncbi:MAG: hypothetical protein ACQESK_03310 [Bacteroidota bacterium]